MHVLEVFLLYCSIIYMLMILLKQFSCLLRKINVGLCSDSCIKLPDLEYVMSAFEFKNKEP